MRRRWGPNVIVFSPGGPLTAQLRAVDSPGYQGTVETVTAQCPPCCSDVASMREYTKVMECRRRHG